MSQITYYTTAPTERNPFKYLVEIGEVLPRHLARLRVRKRLTSRPMTQKEEDHHALCWREECIRYKTAEELLQDEITINYSTDFIKELKVLLK